MDNNNWRPIQGEFSMDENDWRLQLSFDHRHMIVTYMLQERFEEEIYASATSQSDYLRKISLKMLAMETESQNTGSLHSTAQTRGDDWQEEVYQKIKTMKDMYLSELTVMYNKIAFKCQQLDALPQPPKSERIDRLRMFKTILERMIAFLQVSKNNILPSYKDKLGAYEKQITNVISSNRPQKLASTQQS